MKKVCLFILLALFVSNTQAGSGSNTAGALLGSMAGTALMTAATRDSGGSSEFRANVRADLATLANKIDNLVIQMHDLKYEIRDLKSRIRVLEAK